MKANREAREFARNRLSVQEAMDAFILPDDDEGETFARLEYLGSREMAMSRLGRLIERSARDRRMSEI